ncbi:hypothetical protein [Pseudoduganella namucuonensis]|uniref:6-phosphogluconate dehydrogenase n=1 Tax=Pseudoduganella namucuonensis TaxID=1035707 RepID=A0A1I7KWY5_9BURK|nr:hypothetical protein [Pseudoduganella namucuonensis]SFV01927.1 hypothetical protein SAMN05216552_1020103 [Pseudoduganella namucuonensis]
MTKPLRIKLILFCLVLAAGLAFALYAWIALSVSYSEGERAGYLQKFSKRGWICKTWEGELLLTSMPGAIPEKFEFSVRDPLVAEQLTAATGKRVLISYAQHKGVPTQCFGETEYYAERVQLQQP